MAAASAVFPVASWGELGFEELPDDEQPASILTLEEQLAHEVRVARVASERGDHALAIVHLERALTLCPGAPVLAAQLHLARARQAADLGQVALVEALVAHARALSPSCLEPGDALLQKLRVQGKHRSSFGFLARRR
jgi:hypothetical protein